MVSESQLGIKGWHKRWRRRSDVRRLPSPCRRRRHHPFLRRSLRRSHHDLRILPRIRRVLVVVRLTGIVARSRGPVITCEL